MKQRIRYRSPFLSELVPILRKKALKSLGNHIKSKISVTIHDIVARQIRRRTPTGGAAFGVEARSGGLVDGQGEDFLFAEDGSLKGEAVLPATESADLAPPWHVLVVDDDEEVHSVTRYALRKVRFRDRPLHLLSAHSSAEALSLLTERPDIALVLLDVVMETDDAGLRLVRAIRRELNNATIRIILRTGQPGQAPEERVIVDYDVNDYKAKTELTAQKLFTAVIAALRAYDDVMAIEASRRALRRMIALDDRLRPDMGLEAYAQTVLEETGPILNAATSGLVCTVSPDAEGGLDAPRYRPVAACGAYGGVTLPLPGDGLHALLAGMERQRQTRVEGQRAMLHLPGADGTLFLALIDCDRALNGADENILGVLAAKFAAGLANIVLYERLRRANADLRGLAQTLENRVADRTRELSEANAKLQQLASIDGLTGIMNRRRFMEVAEVERDRAHRYQRSFSLLLIDLDRFKRINDSYGHHAGDTVIRRSAERIAGALRAADSLARYGGEELVALLPETGLEAAGRVAERVRAAIEASPIAHEGQPISLTISIGVAEWAGGDENLVALLDRADRALYGAKQAGRNRVELAGLTVS